VVGKQAKTSAADIEQQREMPLQLPLLLIHKQTDHGCTDVQQHGGRLEVECIRWHNLKLTSGGQQLAHSTRVPQVQQPQQQQQQHGSNGTHTAGDALQLLQLCLLREALPPAMSMQHTLCYTQCPAWVASKQRCCAAAATLCCHASSIMYPNRL
jgi:hypothetical protein